MSNNRFVKASLAIVSLLLVLSIGLNVVLYQRGRDYYLELNNTRLDPLGLNTYPTETASDVSSAEQTLVVLFGDSRVADWTLPQIAGVTIINRGIGAQTTAQVLGRLSDHVLSLKPDIVLVQVGINDLKTIPLFPVHKATIISACKSNIQQIVERLTQNGTHVILTTIFPLGELPLERRPFWSDDVAIAIADVNQFIVSLESKQVAIFDTARILANEDGITDPLYSKDFLHLNGTGYEALNHELKNVLQP